VVESNIKVGGKEGFAFFSGDEDFYIRHYRK